MRHKKLLSGLLLFFMLSCSFLGGNFPEHLDAGQSLPYQQDSIASQAGGLSEFISQEISSSAPQAALLRQTTHRRLISAGMGPGLTIMPLVSGIFFALIAFFFLIFTTTSRSQIFIMEYIHHKDGQKA